MGGKAKAFSSDDKSDSVSEEESRSTPEVDGSRRRKSVSGRKFEELSPCFNEVDNNIYLLRTDDGISKWVPHLTGIAESSIVKRRLQSQRASNAPPRRHESSQPRLGVSPHRRHASSL